MSRPDLSDVLDSLSVRYSGLLERFGDIVDENAPPPIPPAEYTAKEARLAASIDESTASAERQIALLGLEAHRHEQIGRLALYISDYEAAFGDPEHAPPMRDLGWDHMELASGLRGTIGDEQERQKAARHAAAAQRADGLMRDFVSAATLTEPLYKPGKPNGNDQRRVAGREL